MSADALRTTAALVPALAAAPRDALVENVHTAVMAKMELADIDQDVKVCHHHHHHHYCCYLSNILFYDRKQPFLV